MCGAQWVGILGERAPYANSMRAKPPNNIRLVGHLADI